MNKTKPKRPPLSEGILASLNEVEEWARGERTFITTEKVNGKRVMTEETGPQFIARRAKAQEPECIQHYTVLLQWSEPDKVFLAKMPELPGCMAEGKTQEEALKNIREAARVWIEAARGSGRPIPQPGTFDIAA